MKLHQVNNKTNYDIATEWDEIAMTRLCQMESGNDLSFTYILVPTIFKLSSNCDFSLVLDVGCGNGLLTNKIASNATSVVGVDLSEKNIKIANEKYSAKNIKYIHSSIEDYTNINKESNFTLAIANMTLMDVIDLEAAIKSINKVLISGAYFVFTITHPYFWPLYWGYYNSNWFQYNKEIPIEANFNISLDNSNDSLLTTHIHRPLEMYINCLLNNGFKIEEISEPMPDGKLNNIYPEQWKFPRFLGVKCKKI